MNENVFRRVEKKYIISKSQKEELFQMIDNYIEKDEYFESHISNIYFDNDNCDLISASLERPIFKTKIRLRSYDRYTTEKSKVFFEIKDKYDGVVNKRRIKITLSDFYKYINGEKISDEQIAKEIDYYFKKYNLKPFMFVGYDRLSYRDKNSSIRITIDANLRSRCDNLKLDKTSKNKLYFDEDMYIMEIKILDAMPLWLTNSLSSLNIYPETFSKIGAIYTKLNKERSEILC